MIAIDQQRSVFNHESIIDKQVDDLRDRMRLLQQDRRANIDLVEANKAANSNEVRSLKEDNKKLRMRLSNLQKSASLDHDAQHHSDVDGMKKLVLHKRNEYDTHKSAVTKLSSKLNKLKDEARICRLDEQRPTQEENGPLSRQIRSLENRLDKAMIQYNEAYGICSTYEHIVKRLKEERVSFDNQLTQELNEHWNQSIETLRNWSCCQAMQVMPGKLHSKIYKNPSGHWKTTKLDAHVIFVNSSNMSRYVSK